MGDELKLASSSGLEIEGFTTNADMSSLRWWSRALTAVELATNAQQTVG
jgi:hypothetical protein